MGAEVQGCGLARAQKTCSELSGEARSLRPRVRDWRGPHFWAHLWGSSPGQHTPASSVLSQRASLTTIREVGAGCEDPPRAEGWGAGVTAPASQGSVPAPSSAASLTASPRPA